PGIALQAGIEEARRILQRSALGEGHLHDTLVGLAGADDAAVRPHRNAAPLPLLDHIGHSLLDERPNLREHLAAPITQLLDARIDQTRRRVCVFAFLWAALLHGCFLHDLSLTSSRRAICWPVSPRRRTELRGAHHPRGCRGNARPSAWTCRAAKAAATHRGRRPP